MPVCSLEGNGSTGLLGSTLATKSLKTVPTFNGVLFTPNSQTILLPSVATFSNAMLLSSSPVQPPQSTQPLSPVTFSYGVPGSYVSVTSPQVLVLASTS